MDKAMSSRPILFSGSMIRGLLADTKTQTRRIVKPQPTWDGNWFSWSGNRPGSPYGACAGNTLDTAFFMRSSCPYGQPGDRLWVKETFIAWGRWETRFSEKKGRDEWHFEDLTLDLGRAYLYATDSPDVNGAKKGMRTPLAPTWWKRPAIFMPRAASRITLELTDVRVERLQDISEADARAEGAPPSHPSIDRISREYGYADFPRSWYAQLWDEINGAGAWAANPWVWALSFRRLP